MSMTKKKRGRPPERLVGEDDINLPIRESDLKTVRDAERQNLDMGIELIQMYYDLLLKTEKVNREPYVHHLSGRMVYPSYYTLPDHRKMSPEEREQFIQRLDRMAEIWTKVSPQITNSSKVLLGNEKKAKPKKEEVKLRLDELIDVPQIGMTNGKRTLKLDD